VKVLKENTIACWISHYAVAYKVAMADMHLQRAQEGNN